MGNSYNRDLGDGRHHDEPDAATATTAPDATVPGAVTPDATAPDATAPDATVPRVIDCDEPWFTHIREGRKPVEGRKASPTWADIEVGNVLVFRNAADGEHCFVARVTGVTRYEGPGALRRYLEGETLARALPGVEDLDAGEAVYLQWSTREEIDRYGMLGIQIAVTMEGY